MRKLFILPAIAILLFATGSLFAQPERPFGVHGVGPRLGVTIDPDQFHIGGQLDLGDLAERLMIIPSLEIGFGDNVTIITPMFDVQYRFREDWGSWNPYLGAGIGPVFISADHGGDNTELGLTIQGGIARRMVSQTGFFFLEGKLGLVDYPDVRLSAGWNFGS